MALCISKKNEGWTGWPGRGGLVCDGVAVGRGWQNFEHLLGIWLDLVCIF